MVTRIERGPKYPRYPHYNADNIKGLLDSRDAIIEDHTRAYETWLAQRRKLVQQIQLGVRTMVPPSEGTFGQAALPLVGHDPKRDKPDSLKDILLFQEQKLTIFDASGELEARLPGRFIRWAFGWPGENQLPEELLKSQAWASGVVIEFGFRRKFGKPNNRFVLTHVNNANIDGGRRILTLQGELRAIGLDIKR